MPDVRKAARAPALKLTLTLTLTEIKISKVRSYNPSVTRLMSSIAFHRTTGHHAAGQAASQQISITLAIGLT